MYCDMHDRAARKTINATGGIAAINKSKRTNADEYTNGDIEMQRLLPS